MFVELDKNSSIPIRKQLYDAFTYKILTGELAEGDKLPSTRELAVQLGIARNTIIEIYEQLISEAYLKPVKSKGTFVCKVKADVLAVGANRNHGTARTAEVSRMSHKSSCIDFETGIPDLGSFPRKAWLRALKESLEYAQDDDMGYAPAFGYRPLREELARYLFNHKGISCSFRQIVIVNGTSDAVAMLAALFKKTVGKVIVESAVISFVPDIFHESGYGMIPVKADQSGICTEDLPELDGGLIFTSSSHQFPLGGTLSIERRRQLVDYAKTHRHYIIEDDYDSEFRYVGAPVNALYQLAPQNVIHLGTFSKTLAPFLRLGYIVLPSNLVSQVKKLKALMYSRVNTHSQMALHLFIAQGAYARHVNLMRKVYKKKMSCIKDSLQQEFGNCIQIFGTNSGIHVAITFPKPIFNAENRAVFSKHEVGVELLTDYTLDRQAGNGSCDTLILGFGNLSEKAIKEGIRRLRLSVDKLRNGEF